jgi:hypothetical protein
MKPGLECDRAGMHAIGRIAEGSLHCYYEGYMELGTATVCGSPGRARLSYHRVAARISQIRPHPHLDRVHGPGGCFATGTDGAM